MTTTKKRSEQEKLKTKGPLKIGQIVNKFEVVNLLGSGGFASVFKVKDKRSKKCYALKIELEKPKQDEAGVELEVSVLKLLQNDNHFLQYIDNGILDDHHYVIMQLAGKNLAELRNACPKKCFTESTALRLAEQTMDAIEYMHGSGLLHRDIKPSNFAIGSAELESKFIYLFDFGLVRQFRTKDGSVRPMRKKTGFRGTVKYASINCHKNRDLGRHDDLWSWLYMVLEFLKGELPWQAEVDRSKALKIKEKSKETLLDGVESEFEQIYADLDSLNYPDEPPYHVFRSRLFQIMQKKNVKSDDFWDWQEGGAYHKEAKSVCDQPYESQIKSKDKVIKEIIGEDQLQN